MAIPESREHSWTPNVRDSQPVLTRANGDCRIVWWSDRSRPKSKCAGTAPAEVVRAPIVGGIT